MIRHTQKHSAFSKITKHQYIWKELSYFVYLFHVVAHPWNLQCYYAVLVRYGLACPKLSEITNHQHLWKGIRDFAVFLHVVIHILLDIHWNYKNMLFWVGTVRHGLSTNQIARCFKLTNLKIMRATTLIFSM